MTKTKSRQASFHLGVAIWLNQEFGRRVFAGVRRVTEPAGNIDLELLQPAGATVKEIRPNRAERRSRASAQAGPDHFDGLVAVVDDDELQPILSNSRLPVVTVARLFHERPAPTVGPDPEAIGRTAAEYLATLHLKHLVVAGFSPGPAFDGLCAEFRAVATTKGAVCLPPFATRDESPRHLGAWLRHLPRPVGILCLNDLAAVDMVRAAKLIGRVVPDDIALLGIGDDPIACMLEREAVSSIAVNPERIGEEAARMLLDKIHGLPVVSCRVPPAGVCERATTRMSALPDRAVAQAVLYIRRHLNRNLGIAEIAARVGLPRRTLEHRFRRCLNRAPYEELCRCRVAHACKLLAAGELSIKAVGAAVGHPRVQHFSRFFKRHTGLTPLEFHQQHGSQGKVS